MQDTAMDDLEMDEMFDKHLEEHEAPFDDDQATGRSNAVPAHVQQRHSQFDDVDDDDASMGDLENYEEAEYVPGSSLTPQASIPQQNDPFAFQRQQPQSQPWVVPPKEGMKRVASRELQQPPTQEVAPCAADFKIIRVIGKGSFGKVFLVRQVRTNKTFAMKVLKKENIVKRNQVEHTRTERSVRSAASRVRRRVAASHRYGRRLGVARH